MKKDYYVLASSRADAHLLIVRFLRDGQMSGRIKSNLDDALIAKDSHYGLSVWIVTTETKIKSSGMIEQ